MSFDQNALLLKGMGRLSRHYVEKLAESRRAFEGFAAHARRARFSVAQREEIETLAHRLAGTGSTYGFERISEAGRTLELLARRRPSMASVELDCEEDHLLKALRGMIEAIRHAQDTKCDVIDASQDDRTRKGADANSKRPSVLIVDDDPQIRNLLMLSLQDDADLAMARSSEEALRRIAGKSPDFVLMDNHLSGDMTGVQLLEHLRRLRPDPLAETAIIMVTAAHDVETVKRAALTGAIDYVTKPFTIETIEEKILSRVRRRRKTILVVDDDPHIQEFLQETLSRAGFGTCFAGDGAAALRLTSKVQPDLILLDFGLPKLDGMSVLERIRETPSTAWTPVIMMSADREAATIASAQSLGVSDYCIKPFKPQFIVERCLRFV